MSEMNSFSEEQYIKFIQKTINEEVFKQTIEV